MCVFKVLYLYREYQIVKCHLRSLGPATQYDLFEAKNRKVNLICLPRIWKSVDDQQASLGDRALPRHDGSASSPISPFPASVKFNGSLLSLCLLDTNHEPKK
jgi:hypothetical protein